MFTQGRMKGFARGLTLVVFWGQDRTVPRCGGISFFGWVCARACGALLGGIFQGNSLGQRTLVHQKQKQSLQRAVFSKFLVQKLCGGEKVLLQYPSNEIPFFNLTLLWCFKNVFRTDWRETGWITQTDVFRLNCQFLQNLPSFCTYHRKTFKTRAFSRMEGLLFIFSNCYPYRSFCLHVHSQNSSQNPPQISSSRRQNH